jgi:ElaB/YqjD/DUF883 family membrane-anchored ribosome-binding protein
MATVNDASTPAGETAAPRPGVAEQARAKVGEAAQGLKGQATEKAREYALLGKDKATGGLDGLYGLIEDAAKAIDDKVGPEFGGYAHRAAEMVSGLNDSIRAKDVDELLDDAKTIIRKNPALAIGAAAIVGFALARMMKAGMDDGADDGAPAGGARG